MMENKILKAKLLLYSALVEQRAYKLTISELNIFSELAQDKDVQKIIEKKRPQ